MYQLMKKYRLVFCIFFGLCFSIPAWANSFKLIQSYPVHHPIFIQGLQLDGSNRLVYSAGLYGMVGRKSVILIWQQAKHMALKNLLRLFLLKA